MTKLELMDYCWSRDLNYDVDMFTVAAKAGCKDIPTRTEYRAYCNKAFEEMLKWMDQQYEDTRTADKRTPEQRYRDEAGFRFNDTENTR